MKNIFFIILLILGFGVANADESSYYSILKNSKHSYPVDKNFIVMLKPTNPDDLRSAGYIKFTVSILYNDKSVSKELDAKIDIVRSVIIDTVSGFAKTDLQGQDGKIKLTMAITASINAILTDSSVDGVAFPEYIIQP